MKWQTDLLEAQFQAQVEQLATMHGWAWMHMDKALNDRGRWRTPVRGGLGPGFPDLLLVKGERIIFAELKRQGSKPTGLQDEVLTTLSQVKCAEVYVWRPADWPLILECLGGTTDAPTR